MNSRDLLIVRRFVAACVIVLLFYVMTWHALAQGQKQQPKSLTIQPQHKGEVRQVRAQELKRLDRPLETPRFHRPEERDGMRWRWHSGYGQWIGFGPGVQLPAVDILPADFALPAQVSYFDMRATQEIVCPCCNCKFQVEIR